MTTVTVFFAAAQTGQAICDTADYWAPLAGLTALYGLHRVWRRVARRSHRRDLRRFYRWPAPDLDDQHEQAVDDLITCRRLYRTEPIDHQQRNTGNLQPRKEKP